MEVMEHVDQGRIVFFVGVAVHVDPPVGKFVLVLYCDDSVGSLIFGASRPLHERCDPGVGQRNGSLVNKVYPSYRA